MKTWEIVPFTSVGPVRFGMSRSGARHLLGEHFSTFRKTPQSQSETDAYDSLGLHLHYDCEERLIFAEAFAQCGVTLEGVSFMSRPLAEAIQEMASIGQSAIYDGSSCYCFEKIGVILCVTYSENTIESIGVSARDHFKDYMTLWKELEEKRRLREERRKSRPPVKNPFLSE
jgi:hypothetical protein